MCSVSAKGHFSKVVEPLMTPAWNTKAPSFLSVSGIWTIWRTPCLLIRTSKQRTKNPSNTAKNLFSQEMPWSSRIVRYVCVISYVISNRVHDLRTLQRIHLLLPTSSSHPPSRLVGVMEVRLVWQGMRVANPLARVSYLRISALQDPL